MVQFFKTPAEAVADIPDGVTIAFHVWTLSGTPSQLILAIRDKGIKDLTLVAPNFIRVPAFPEQIPNSSTLLPQAKKIITTFVGYRAFGGGDDTLLGDRVKRGELELEIDGHGNWVLRLLAGAARMGGFYTPVGVGTELEQGREVRVIDGQKYIFVKALRPDVGLLRAYKADKLGNLSYYGTERAPAPIIAQASKLTIAEVEEIVEVGELHPEEIVTPSAFVDRVVKIPDGAIGSRRQKMGLIPRLARHDVAQKRYFAIATPAQTERAARPAEEDRLTPDVIAMRAARELKAGDCVNLGLGMPSLVATYVPKGVRFMTENGCLGYGPLVTVDEVDKADYGLTDASNHYFTAAPGMSIFDMLTADNMLRSERLIGILGALEVAENGDLANHSLGSGDYAQIGGGMDVAWGAKRLIVCMSHTTRNGRPRILKECKLPVTVKGKVNLIITDIAVIEVTQRGLLLKEVAPGWRAEEVQSLTEAKLTVADDLAEMTL